MRVLQDLLLHLGVHRFQDCYLTTNDRWRGISNDLCNLYENPNASANCVKRRDARRHVLLVAARLKNAFTSPI